jgi:hypothetical protein
MARPASAPYARSVKRLIWLYLILLIFEGAIRKWILPQLSDVLLIGRDPLVLMIYGFAFLDRRFPSNRIITGTLILGILSMAFGMIANGNLIVTLYGIRINYLQIPLIFVIPCYFDLRDVHRVGKFLLLCSIGMTALLVMQFYAPSGSWVNRAPGGIEGEGIMGAKGRNRPPGTFSFVTGVASFYPVVTAFLLTGFLRIRFFGTALMLAVAAAVVTAMFVSISRLTFLSCLVVAGACVISLAYMRVKSRALMTLAVGSGFLILLLPSLGFFREGMATFEERWTRASDMEEGAEAQSLAKRYATNFTTVQYALAEADFFGKGVGVGSNMGSKFLTGSVGFSMGEHEWEKIVHELGPLLGLAYIGLRISLFLSIGWTSFSALRNQKNPLPFLLFAATGLLLLNGQWGPPTIQGFATLGAGLSLAACRLPPKKQPQPPKRSPGQTAEITAPAPIPTAKPLDKPDHPHA